MKKQIVIAMMFVLTVIVQGNVRAESCGHKTCFQGNPEPILGYNIPLENMIEFMCNEYLNVINPQACVEGLRGCVMDQMSLRIYEPDLTENERAFNALVQCLIGK